MLLPILIEKVSERRCLVHISPNRSNSHASSLRV